MTCAELVEEETDDEDEEEELDATVVAVVASVVGVAALVVAVAALVVAVAALVVAVAALVVAVAALVELEVAAGTVVADVVAAEATVLVELWPEYDSAARSENAPVRPRLLARVNRVRLEIFFSPSLRALAWWGDMD